jgi:non-specific serine/threonine protein kinase/serine/threonine-protein kinase
VTDEHDLRPTIRSEETTKKLSQTKDLDQMVPGFRLLQKLGEGGMGEVFEAEQLEPVRRKVALKLIKRGMESKEVLARFDSERQALALMSHPNIAQVYDAGTTSDGRPYFVMEFVQGVPVTRYCDTNRLTTNERLELFTQICEGVQHAHQKGVIHRDLKPSNVLVKVQDSKPVPKIIDFGVSKAIAQRLTEQTLFTAIGEFIGTPEYMSPEQAEMTELDIDTRTDVYALGVVLYELLVGAQPFDAAELRRSGFDEMRRKIREDEPPRPSMRLSAMGERSVTAAENRRSEPSTLSRKIHGDLDWITMKALEKDRTRRYDSPGELAADIGRHLRHEPVVAGPPSATYRVKKFVRRHTIGVAASALVVLALVLGILGTTAGMVRARKAEQAASREAETAQQVSDFLVGLFKVSDPIEGSGEKVTAREMLDKGADRIRNELTDQPLVQARLMSTMGWVYISLGLYDTAQELLEEALAIREVELPPNHADVSISLNELAEAHREKAEYDEAWPLYERSLAIREDIFGPESPQVSSVLNNMALVLVDRGEYEEAGLMYERMLAIDRQSLGPDDPELASSLHNVAILHVRKGELDEARALFERVLEIREAAYGTDHILVANNLASLGAVLKDGGDYQAARPLYEKSLEIKEKILGPDHPVVAGTLANLGALLRIMNEPEQARSALERSVAIYRKTRGPDHPDVAEPLTTLAIVHATTGQPDAAQALFEEALAIRENALGPDHREVATSLNNLGVFHRSTGDNQAARTYYERAMQANEMSLGPDHPQVAMAMTNLANLVTDLGDYEEAEELYQRALVIREEALGPDHPDVGYTVIGLGSLYETMGDLERALPYVARTVEIWEKALGPEHPQVMAVTETYADLLRRLGDEAGAKEAADRAASVREKLESE